MVLEFRPPYEINPYEQRPREKQISQFGNQLNSYADNFLAFKQQQIENDRQSQMMKWKAAEEGRHAEANQPLSDFMSPSPSGSLQQGTVGPMPNYSPESGGSSYVSPGQNGPAVDHTSHFNAWKSMGMPSSYSHADYGGSGQGQGGSQFDPSVYGRLPGSQREAYLNMGKESGALALQDSEIQKNRAQADYFKNRPPAGTPGASKPQLRLNQFSGEWEWYSPPAATPPAGSAPGTPSPSPAKPSMFGSPTGTAAPAPAAGGAKIPFKERAKLEAEARETEALVNNVTTEITRVRELNKRSRGGWSGSTIQKVQSGLNMGTDSQEFKNTADVVNTLKGAVSRVLKSTFGGQLSDSEREYLNTIYGASDKMSPQERDIAMQNVLTILSGKSSGARAKAGLGGGGNGGGGGGGGPQTVQRKGADGQIYTYTLNPQTGKYE